MATIVYNNAAAEFLKGNIDLVNDDIRCMLITTLTTTPDNPDHDFVTDIAADEANPTNYARQALTTKSVAVDDVLDLAKYDFDDVSFGILGNGTNETIVAAVFFKFVTDDTDSILLWYADFGDTTTDGTEFKLEVGTDGGFHATKA